MHRAVRTFKANFVEARFTSLIVSLLVIGMRLAMMFSLTGLPDTVYPDTGYVWQFAEGWISDPRISFVAGTLSVFVIAWLIASLNNRFSLIRTRTNLPFIVPLFLFSLHPYFLMMSPDYVGIIFILMAFFPLLKSYQQTGAQVYSFQSAVLIGLASLFQIYALFLLLLWWKGEVWMRGTHFKSFLSFVFGVLLVFWSVFAVYFFFDDVPGFLNPFLFFADLSVPAVPQLSVWQWIGTVLIFMFFILYLYFSMRTYARNKVLTLSTMQFMAWLLVFLIILQVVYWSESLFFLSLGIAFISYLIAHFYTMITSKTPVYIAYAVIVLLVLFYLIHCFSFFPPDLTTISFV